MKINPNYLNMYYLLKLHRGYLLLTKRKRNPLHLLFKNIASYCRKGGLRRRGYIICIMHVHSVIQSFPTLCNPIVCSPPGSSVHGIFPGKNSRLDCHSLPQDLPTPEMHLCLLCLICGSEHVRVLC